MPSLETLLNDLANQDALHDLQGLRRVREQIVADFPETDAASEAFYKLGLDTLFRERHLDRAIGFFVEATKLKHAFWSNAARTSLGLCYYHQNRMQKALFELRRVAVVEKPTSHSVTALTFMENIFTEEGQADEVKKLRKERVRQLTTLAAEAATDGKPIEHGFYLYTLGLAHKDSGDTAAAVHALHEAKNLGPDKLGAELYRSVIEALS